MRFHIERFHIELARNGTLSLHDHELLGVWYSVNENSDLYKSLAELVRLANVGAAAEARPVAILYAPDDVTEEQMASVKERFSMKVDPDLQRILDALGIPEAESLHDILERIKELTPEAEPPVTVEMLNEAFESVSGVGEVSRGPMTPSGFQQEYPHSPALTTGRLSTRDPREQSIPDPPHGWAPSPYNRVICGNRLGDWECTEDAGHDGEHSFNGEVVW